MFCEIEPGYDNNNYKVCKFLSLLGVGAMDVVLKARPSSTNNHD